MNDLNKDMSTLTTIPKLTLDELSNKTENYMLHEVHSTLLNHEVLTEFNIGYGTLSIVTDADYIQYTFTPSKSFESKMIECVKYNKDYLIESLEKKLEDKIHIAYKDLY